MNKILHICISLLIGFSGFSYAESNDDSSLIQSSEVNPLYYYDEFKGKDIKEDKTILSLQLPNRAEDAAFVPLKINIGPSQKELFIKKIWLFIDKNPVPLAGVFEFGSASVHADLAFRIRVNEHSFVRAVAQTNSGELYHYSHFIKASGGCSAPVGSDIIENKKHLGEMRFSTDAKSSGGSLLAKLRIRHINLTGLQMNQVTRIRELPHYIKNIKVTLDDELLFTAKTGISISEDPSFRFYIPTNKKNGKLKVELLDTKDQGFSSKFGV